MSRLMMIFMVLFSTSLLAKTTEKTNEVKTRAPAAQPGEYACYESFPTQLNADVRTVCDPSRNLSLVRSDPARPGQLATYTFCCIQK